MRILHGTSPSSAKQPQRQALTTLEMLLVLGILLIIAGMAMPAVENAYQSHRLEQTVEMVRQELAGARVHAIDTGVVYQFRYEPGKQQFIVVPDKGALDAAGEGAEFYRFAGQIPESIYFRESEDVVGTAESLDASWFTGLPGAIRLAKAAWSPPIEFHFDGNAQDSSLLVMDEDGRYIRLSVRGLTGAVKVHPLEFEEDSQ